MNSTQTTLFAIASIFLMCFLLVALPQTAQATTAAEMREKGQQCLDWVSTGALRLDRARRCISACERYGHSVELHPETLNEAGVQRCNDAYAGTKNQVPGMKEPEPEPPPTPNTLEEIEAKVIASLPDIEGVYLRAMKGRLRIRVENRDDWQKICREYVRVKDPDYKLARSLKGFDRIRITGITYDPDRAGKGKFGPCNAEAGVRLGPSE